MTLCCYITGHGYGHAIRTAQILKALPAELPCILRTTVPERLFQEEIPDRALTYAPAEFDCGCLQSDSVTVLPRATLARYAQIAEANDARLDAEAAFLQQHGVQIVVTDIASFPLRAACLAGIPGYAVANFTWHDIYQDYVEMPEDQALLDKMREEYAAATTAFLTPLATPTVAVPFPHVEQVPLVARRGSTMTDRLWKWVGTSNHLALVYLGIWGMNLDWEALGRMDEWTFLVYEPPPRPQPNIVVLNRQVWPYADVAASVDAVVSKAGYGTVTECIANGVPLIYVARTAFSEYEALVSGMARWGGGVPLSDRNFQAGHWEDALNAALSVTCDPHVFPVNGAQVIAERLLIGLLE